jgi:hypothetical protein
VKETECAPDPSNKFRKAHAGKRIFLDPVGRNAGHVFEAAWANAKIAIGSPDSSIAAWRAGELNGAC